MPGADIARAARSDDELDVEVKVLPGPTPTPERVLEWPGRPRPDAPIETVGTVSALITQVSVDASGERADSAAFDLVVLDDRGGAPGWMVTISSEPDAGGDPPAEISRYLRRTEVIGESRPRPEQMPHGTRLSVGQPLDRETPVIVAPTGSGQGAYWIRFAVAGNPQLPPALMILTLTTAP